MFLLECYDVGGDSESSSAFPAKAFLFLKSIAEAFPVFILVINWNFQIIKHLS